MSISEGPGLETWDMAPEQGPHWRSSVLKRNWRYLVSLQSVGVCEQPHRTGLQTVYWSHWGSHIWF